jgi:hypothetical protein
MADTRKALLERQLDAHEPPEKRSAAMQAYLDGYNEGAKAEEGQRRTTIDAGPPRKPKGPADEIGHYNQGYYEGASASDGQRATQRAGQSGPK